MNATFCVRNFGVFSYQKRSEFWHFLSQKLSVKKSFHSPLDSFVKIIFLPIFSFPTYSENSLWADTLGRYRFSVSNFDIFAPKKSPKAIWNTIKIYRISMEFGDKNFDERWWKVISINRLFRLIAASLIYSLTMKNRE